jgi:hypothetical protein
MRTVSATADHHAVAGQACNISATPSSGHEVITKLALNGIRNDILTRNIVDAQAPDIVWPPLARQSLHGQKPILQKNNLRFLHLSGLKGLLVSKPRGETIV